MAEKENLAGGKKELTINLNGTEYKESDLTDQQKVMVNHILDLERKIGQMQFNLDQLNVGRQAFMNLLETSLKEEVAQDVESVEPAAAE